MGTAEERVLAYRYAQAFLHMQDEPFSVETCKDLGSLATFYGAEPTLLFYLQLSLFDDASKRNALAHVRTFYHVPSALATLDLLLLAHNRITLLPHVYYALQTLLYKHIGHVPCIVTSAQKLTEKEQEICVQFVADYTGLHPLITWHIDQTLIAGVRIKTDEWLWEYSLDAQLRSLAHALLT